MLPCLGRQLQLVHEAAVACASQFFFIESFKWDVIEKTASACRRNYNMQMLLLFATTPTNPPPPLMRCDQKSPGLRSLGFSVHWWRQSWHQWTLAVNNYACILTRVTQGQPVVHCLYRLIGIYSFLTKSCPGNVLTMHCLWADVFLR